MPPFIINVPTDHNSWPPLTFSPVAEKPGRCREVILEVRARSQYSSKRFQGCSSHAWQDHGKNLQSLNFSESISHSSLNQLVRDFNMFQFFYHHSLLSAEFRSNHESRLLKSLFKYILLLTWHGTSIGLYRRLRWFVISLIFKQLKIKISFGEHLCSYYSSKQRIIFYMHLTKLAQEKKFCRYPN